jgi:hypothetical protein
MNNRMLNIFIKLEMLTKGLFEAEKKIEGLDKTIKKLETQNKRWVTRNRTLLKQNKQLTAGLKQTTKSLFNMKVGMFGTLFFGMSLQRMFFGMLEPAMQLTGIFELLSTTLGVTFLPIAMLLLDVLLPIMEFFMNLPESVQLAIGIFVLLGGILGAIITGIMFLSIGLASMGPAFAIVGTIVSMVVTGFWSLMTVFFEFFPVIAVLSAVLVAAILLWKTNFGGFRDFVVNLFKTLWNLLKGVFSGISDVVKNTIEIIKAIFTGDWDKVLGLLVNGAAIMAKMMLGVFIRLGAMIVNVLIFAINFVLDVIQKVLLGGVVAILKTIFSLLAKLPGKTGANMRGVADQMTALQGAIKNNSFNVNYVQSADVERGVEKANNMVNNAQTNVNQALSLNVTVNAPKEYTATIRGAGTQ